LKHWTCEIPHFVVHEMQLAQSVAGQAVAQVVSVLLHAITQEGLGVAVDGSAWWEVSRH
jgi:hypothetical protein